MKPIIRWTFGDPKNQQSYDCLKISIRNFINIYKNDFDYFLLHNNCDKEKLLYILKDFKINLIEQNWGDCPIKHEYTPVSTELDSNGNFFGGSMWKWCPPRLDIKKHEIIIDNDIVFIRYLKKIYDFVESNKTLLTEDPLAFHGNYSHLFKKNEKFNAGFLGIPPNLDIGEEMKNLWQDNGRLNYLTQADEQGLSTAVLKKFNLIKITKKEILELHPNGHPVPSDASDTKFKLKNVKININHNAYHFVELNRKKHKYWEIFLKKEKFFSKIT